MTAAIKRMLAEQATMSASKTAAGPALPAVDEDLLAQVERAAPYIDAGCVAGWPPSAKLQMWFFAMVTGAGDGDDRRARRWLQRMLDKARDRWLQGLHPNPLLDEPESRK